MKHLVIISVIGLLSVASTGCGDVSGTSSTAVSAALSSTAAIIAPETVTPTVFSGISTNSIYVKWVPGPNTTYYQLYVSNSLSAVPELLVETSNQNYLHSNLPGGQTNYYRIVSYNSSTNSTGSFASGITRKILPASDPAQTNVRFTNSDGLVYSFDPATGEKPTNELVFMTLNMHTYQEANQDVKFDMIVKAIAAVDADYVTLQECAQRNTSTIVSGTIRDDNMAYILTNRLKEYFGRDYYFTWTWPHYGWNVWEEGIAVLSKYPIQATTSIYLSADTSTSSITSRKVIYAGTVAPGFGKINVFSIHTHWMTSSSDTGLVNQISNAQALVSQMESNVGQPVLSWLAGDYNSDPISTTPYYYWPYMASTNGGEYLDTFLAANPGANTTGSSKSQYYTMPTGIPGRIDYQYMKTNSMYRVITSQIIFTPSILGLVSDHYGVVCRIRKVN